jgi:hypothetical protein
MDEMRLPLVQEAAARMASRAEHFGLNRLGRLARCLERAAEARDEEASQTRSVPLSCRVEVIMTGTPKAFAASRIRPSSVARVTDANSGQREARRQTW